MKKKSETRREKKMEWNKPLQAKGLRMRDREIKCARKVGRIRKKNEKFLCQLDIRHMRNLKINKFSLGKIDRKRKKRET